MSPDCDIQETIGNFVWEISCEQHRNKQDQQRKLEAFHNVILLYVHPNNTLLIEIK